jgi:nitrate reductase (NAD(P)H)
MDEDGNIELKLSKINKITHDTYIFSYAFDKEDMTFGLPIGGHVIFSANIKTKAHPEGELVCRKYTPISRINQKGHVDFVIKVYRAGGHPKFPEGGIMSQYLESMKLGDTIKMEGPKGRLKYEGYGKFHLSKKIAVKKNIGCVAGGTGITPCY